jgi:hypothetical protein
VTEVNPAISRLTADDLQAVLRRAIRNTLIVGLLASLAVLIGSDWRNAAMLATGALISAASILEWRRLVRVINARIQKQKAPRGAVLVLGFFLLRLLFFATAIYGSLKCFQGSALALVCGLGLAVATLTWEALRLLRD